MKLYAIINGVFYILYGLYGVFMPEHLATNVMGWTPDLLGLHQIRAMWMSSVGFGIIILMMSTKGNLAVLTKAIVFLTLCFMVGRILGLVIDGTGPNQTYGEIGFEVFWSGLGLFLLSRAKLKTTN